MTENFWKSVINFFCLFLSLFLLWIRKYKRKHVLIWYLTDFPVFLLHELSHYLIASLLGARPEPPSFQIEEKINGATEYTMGSVKCHNVNAFNALPIGLAPLLLLIPAILSFHLHLPFGIKLLILTYLLPASRPSKQDLKVALTPSSLLVWLLLLTSSWLCFSYYHNASLSLYHAITTTLTRILHTILQTLHEF